MDYSKLKEVYIWKKSKIQKRLHEFEEVYSQPDARIFEELCFCLCTPQTSAKAADRAINRLADLLFYGTFDEIDAILDEEGVRFHVNKTNYILEARKFSQIKRFLETWQDESSDILNLRDNIVKNVKGLGMKEASHFLRNIGFGDEFAILDRHILKNLKKYNVIDEIPKTLTKNNYLEIEQKMKDFSEKVNIPLAELDLLFWSEETGEIFK